MLQVGKGEEGEGKGEEEEEGMKLMNVGPK
jgi:hypothetical protein